MCIFILIRTLFDILSLFASIYIFTQSSLNKLLKESFLHNPLKTLFSKSIFTIKIRPFVSSAPERLRHVGNIMSLILGFLLFVIYENKFVSEQFSIAVFYLVFFVKFS